jgi:hypothetical protein
MGATTTILQADTILGEDCDKVELKGKGGEIMSNESTK